MVEVSTLIMFAPDDSSICCVRSAVTHIVQVLTEQVPSATDVKSVLISPLTVIVIVSYRSSATALQSKSNVVLPARVTVAVADIF